jgi:hypothetical protein
MKKLFLTITIALGLFFSQKSIAQDYFNYEFIDTVSNSTAVSYVIDFKDLAKYNYEICTTLQADSLSGGTAGVAYVQVSNHDTESLWQTLYSTTINGVQTLALTEDIVYARRIRLYVTGGGTQSTKITWAIKGVRKF